MFTIVIPEFTMRTACKGVPMRPTRLIYVENDPALLGVMSIMLRQERALEVLLTTEDPLEALAFIDVHRADVALLDLALGRDTLTGVDLGLALRSLNLHIGIVIHSQHPLRHITQQIPEHERMGWSCIAKTGTMQAVEYVEVLRDTAAGMIHQVYADGDAQSSVVTSPLSVLTSRQRVIMGLASIGMNAPEISEQLAITPESVRKDLSKAYRTLVPDEGAGSDLRTRAVVQFIRLNGDLELGQS